MAALEYRKSSRKAGFGDHKGAKKTKMGKKQDQNGRDLLLNGSGYRDPTAYKAMRKCIREGEVMRKCNTCENFDESEVMRNRISDGTDETEHEKFQRFLRDLFGLCDAYTYHLESRIVVRDKKNGRIWR